MMEIVEISIHPIIELLKPVHQQALCSCSDVLPTSNDGSNGTRIAALESRLDEMQEKMDNWACDFNHRLRDLGV
jgi:hypothetical protein